MITKIRYFLWRTTRWNFFLHRYELKAFRHARNYDMSVPMFVRYLKNERWRKGN